MEYFWCKEDEEVKLALNFCRKRLQVVYVQVSLVYQNWYIYGKILNFQVAILIDRYFCASVTSIF